MYYIMESMMHTIMDRNFQPPTDSISYVVEVIQIYHFQSSFMFICCMVYYLHDPVVKKLEYSAKDGDFSSLSLYPQISERYMQ